MYNTLTNKTIDVTHELDTDPYGNEYGASTGIHIAIQNDKIVYNKCIDDYEGKPGVYVYSIASGKSTLLIEYPENTYTTPVVYGNTIAWGINDEYSQGTSDTGIYICPLPTISFAAFTADKTSVKNPLTVTFKYTGTGTLDTYLWDFGDGTNSTEQNPMHTYSSSGNYTFELTVSNAAGNYTEKKKGYINVNSVASKLVASFTAFPTTVNAPLNVAFTDTSTGSPTSWNWNFGDGTNSNQQNPTNIYSSAGNYIVTLTISNENGTASNTATINVLEQSSSSGSSNDNGGSNSDGSSSGGSSSGGSSSSNGGGGGGGGSPEPQSNVEVKELSQTFITSGKSVKLDFPRNATPVVYVSCDSKKTAGKTTTIVEMLKDKSTLVSGLPSDEVYKFLNIWVGNSGFATSSNIENAVVCFKVEKSWLQGKNIDRSSIALNRYSNKKWDSLPTNLSGEDDKFLYFTAKTPGFSPFAITGKATAKEYVTETQPKPKTQGLEQNNGTTAANVEQTPEQKENTNTSEKGSTKTPGFEIASGIVCLLSVFLYKRR
jgi:PGF-pre-PGF domain-containing protein